MSARKSSPSRRTSTKTRRPTDSRFAPPATAECLASMMSSAGSEVRPGRVSFTVARSSCAAITVPRWTIPPWEPGHVHEDSRCRAPSTAAQIATTMMMLRTLGSFAISMLSAAAVYYYCTEEQRRGQGYDAQNRPVRHAGFYMKLLQASGGDGCGAPGNALGAPHLVGIITRGKLSQVCSARSACPGC